MKDNTGFLEKKLDPNHCWMLNNHPSRKLRGTEVEVINNNYNITPGIQKVLT